MRAEIVSAKKRLSELSGPLEALHTRRNAWLARTDSDTITDSVKMAALAKLSFPDLQTIFDVTGEIVNQFSRLYRDIYAVLEIIGQTDYENVIEFVSQAKCEQVRQ